jgi:hypothetical protein
LDTGTPQGTTFPILNSVDWFAAEFTATAGETITQLSADLNPNLGGQGTALTFAIYSSTGFIGGRNLTAQYTAGATFEGSGWNSTSANWTVPTTGDYWVVLEMSSSALDLVSRLGNRNLGHHRHRAGACFCGYNFKQSHFFSADR